MQCTLPRDPAGRPVRFRIAVTGVLFERSRRLTAATGVVFSYEEIAHFGGDDGVFERPLPLAGCASLRAASDRAYVGSRRERSAPFEFPPDAG